jgi:hypothetical protein
MSDALDAVEGIYFNAQTNLAPILAGCQTQDQRDQVMTQYVATRQNYWTCINKSFHDDDPALQALVTQANTVAGQLSSIANGLGDITKVIGYLTQGVALGAKIAAKVVTL